MTKQSALPDLLVYGILTGFIRLVAFLPDRMVRCLAAALAWIAPMVGRKDIRMLRSNVARVFRLPAGTHFARMFERQLIRHQACCLLETFATIYRPDRARYSGLEVFRERLGRNPESGLIIVAAHMGSWELCAYQARRAMGRPLHVLAKPSKSAGFTRVLNQLRERMGCDVFWTDRKSLPRDILGALKSGHGVGFVMDQKPEGRKGPVVDFFGIPTEFVSGPATFAARTDCAVIAVYCLRTGPFSYHLVAEPIVEHAHGIKDELELTRRMAAALESMIRIYPEQWTWNYKRWRAAPVAAP